MLTTVSHEQPDAGPPIPEGEITAFDWTARLSIENIRVHCKCDDVPGVTDEQLALYRASSLEAAEMYTGLLLKGSRTVIEPIEGPPLSSQGPWSGSWPGSFSSQPGKISYIVKLKYPSADGIIHLYGGPASANKTFVVPIGSRTVRVPIVTGHIDLSNCCNPCSSHRYNSGMMATYRAGYSCPDDVPHGVVHGCLLFIAWSVEHAGDVLLTQRNRLDISSKGSSGSNNIALVSGAIELWRTYDESAI